MAIITLLVLGDPIPKGRPRTTKAGITYTPGRTRQWERTVAMLAMQEMSRRPMIPGPLRVVVTATFGMPLSWPKWKRELAYQGKLAHTGRPDLDNLAKAAIDACNGIVFRDDSQICEMTVRKQYGERPAVKIEIEELDLVSSQQARKCVA